MSLEKLDYILAVAEAQSLTRAAQALYVSQPTLTNYINKLEETLSVKLFDRSVSPIRVTPAGALYIAKMKKLQTETDVLLNELRQISNQQEYFNIGIGNTRGNHWLPQIIPDFLRLHSELSLQFHEKGEEELEKGLVDGTIDIAIGVLNKISSDLAFEHIVEEPVLLAIPRSFECISHIKSSEALLSKPYFIEAERIRLIPFLFPCPGNGFYRCANLLLEQAGINPIQKVTYRNMNTAYQLSAEGIGAIFITANMFASKYPEYTERLAFCTLQKDIHIRNCVAGFRKENKKQQLIYGLIEIARKNLIPLLY